MKSLKWFKNFRHAKKVWTFFSLSQLPCLEQTSAIMILHLSLSSVIRSKAMLSLLFPVTKELKLSRNVNLRYADDTSLLAGSEEDLQRLLNIVVEESGPFIYSKNKCCFLFIAVTRLKNVRLLY